MSYRRDFILVVVIASAIAGVGARPYAGGWNDGGRLATVEALVDHGTFVIDESIFVQVPSDKSPYSPERDDLRQTGTLDKLLIDGHYYSDKSPVPALLLAGAYRAAQWLTGLTASESPPWFCLLMNLLGGGLPYVVAVVAIFLIAQRVGLSRGRYWLLTLSFAFATIAPAYARHVNNHVMLLGIVSLTTFQMLRVACPESSKSVVSATPFEDSGRATPTWLVLGTLAGLGYTIDLGVGPMLLAAVGGWVAYRGYRARSWRPVTTFTLAALPWLVLHHAINYAIAGTLAPSGANVDYLQWPGSPFNAANMTGRWQHASLVEFALYALDLLVGQRGFLGHNLPLYLALAGLPIIWRRGRWQRPLAVASAAWCVLAFVNYAALSNNYAGLCLSIRWFVPMLAPGYLLLALLLRARPEFARDVLLLSAFNIVTAASGWWYGPWDRPPLWLYWVTVAAGSVAWAAVQLKTNWTRVAQFGAESVAASHVEPLSATCSGIRKNSSSGDAGILANSATRKPNAL